MDTEYKISYSILENRNKINLELEVIKYLKEGWKLSGGVSISHSQGNTLIYAQAMVRE